MDEWRDNWEAYWTLSKAKAMTRNTAKLTVRLDYDKVEYALRSKAIIIAFTFSGLATIVKDWTTQ